MNNKIIFGGGKRLEVFDIAKGIGIILMVLGHCCGIRLYNWIYCFHMPLFFVMSGMFFIPGKYNFLEFLQKRIKQLMIPLIIFLFVIVVLYLILLPEKNILSSFRLGLPGALWFLWVLFLLEMFYFGIDRALKSNKYILLSFAVLSAIFAKWLDVNSYGIRSWYVNAIFVALPFYCIGNIFSRQLKIIVSISMKNVYVVFLSVLLIILPLVVTYHTNKTILIWNSKIPSPILLYYSLAICGTVGVFYISKFFDETNSKIITVLSFLGRNTIPIIAFNQFLIDFSSKIFVCENHMVFKCLQQMLVWSVCLFVIWFCNRYCKKAVGK